MKRYLSLILFCTVIVSAVAQRPIVKAERHIEEPYINILTDTSAVHRARKGIMIVGDSGHVRAFSPFGHSAVRLTGYANAVNVYRDSFPANVSIYCMPIPTAAAFYTPDSASEWTSDQRKSINKMFSALDTNVQPVNIYTILGQHAAEHIYSRTDHHWAPLGAYYAAMHFAEIAGVPFPTLEEYDSIVIPDYVGTMYMYSKDIMVQQSPEDFIYYIPRHTEYTAYYINLKLDKKHHSVISEGEEHTNKFFLTSFSGAASYCVFGGGDYKIIRIATEIHNGRKLLILKDSFGNALTGYLLKSFEEIHVVDCRYFGRNIIKYVTNFGITDILFANNLSHASNENTYNMYLKYLVQ